MGEVRVKCLLANPFEPGRAPLEVDALVDTGAVLPLFGRDIVPATAFLPVRNRRPILPIN